MSKTILVVDDKVSLRAMVKTYLTQAGYRVLTAGDGREALFVAREHKPDLILLDLMMPEMDGYAFIQAHKRERDTPIIILTARVEETDKVLGLELGADDYVTKPFGMRELGARVRAVLRRAGNTAAPADILRVGDVTLDRDGRTVQRHDDVIDLTPSEFDILEQLMQTPGRVFSRGELLDGLSGDAAEGAERTIDVHIRNLRRKLEPNTRQPIYIETVYGVGYRFAPA